MSCNSGDPRLVVTLSKDQKDALNKYIPWGLGQIFWSKIVSDVIELLEDEKLREQLITAVINNKIKLSELLDLEK